MSSLSRAVLLQIILFLRQGYKCPWLFLHTHIGISPNEFIAELNRNLHLQACYLICLSELMHMKSIQSPCLCLQQILIF